MLNKEGAEILNRSKEIGWVLEPEAKQLIKTWGMDTTNFYWASTPEDALNGAHEIGYPVVAKVVSPKALHKSDVGGVTVNILDDDMLTKTYKKYSRMEGFSGILVEEMVSGIELIVGAKIDHQFGPIILLGVGGTSVEIYDDTAIRMAPIKPHDAESMIDSLKAQKLLKGYRGAEPISVKKLSDLLLAFSGLLMEIKDHIESIDLNPIMCTSEKCIVADARIMLI